MAAAIFMIALLIAGFGFSEESILQKDSGMLQKLRKDLLSEYDAFSRPVLHDAKITTVKVGIEPIILTEVDEVRELIIMEGWISMSWDDDFLKWDPKEYGGITVLHLPAKQIWKPDIAVYEGTRRGSENDPFRNVLALVYNSGLVMWVPPATTSSICTFNYANYPHDVQHCTITLGSWTYSGMKLNLIISEEKHHLKNLRNINPQWSVDKMSVERKSKYYDCCTEPYISIISNFTISRRDSLNVVAVRTPLVTSTLLVLVMFWIPFSLWKKLILGCTSLVTITGLIALTTVSTPSIMALPYALCKLKAALILCLAAILLEILICVLGKAAIFLLPQKLRRILRSKAIHYICCKSSSNSKSDGSAVQEELKIEWRILAITVERFTSCIFFIAFLCFGCFT